MSTVNTMSQGYFVPKEKIPLCVGAFYKKLKMFNYHLTT